MSIALLTRLARSIHLAHRRRKARRELRALNDHLLRDIGLERHQIAAYVDQVVTLEGGTPFEPNRNIAPVAAEQATPAPDVIPIWRLPRAA